MKLLIQVVFSVCISKIPVNKYGLTIGDYFGVFYRQSPDSKSWIDRLFVGPFFSHNFRTGKFGGGVTSGFTF